MENIQKLGRLWFIGSTGRGRTKNSGGEKKTIREIVLSKIADRTLEGGRGEREKRARVEDARDG